MTCPECNGAGRKPCLGRWGCFMIQSSRPCAACGGSGYLSFDEPPGEAELRMIDEGCPNTGETP